MHLDLSRAVDGGEGRGRGPLSVGQLHLDAGPLLLDAGGLRLSDAYGSEEEDRCLHAADKEIKACRPAAFFKQNPWSKTTLFVGQFLNPKTTMFLGQREYNGTSLT